MTCCWLSSECVSSHVRDTVVTVRLIIGLDPGGTCGFASLLGDTFESCDLRPYDACLRLERLLARRDVDASVVACERFTLTAESVKKTRQNDALEIIGVARYLATRYNSTAFLLQGASEAQKAANREVLRLLGWWTPGVDHRNKAAAQLALALSRVDPLDYRRRLEPGMLV